MILLAVAIIVSTSISLALSILSERTWSKLGKVSTDFGVGGRLGKMLLGELFLV